MWLTALLLGAAVTVLGAIHRWRYATSCPTIPPGPKGLPIIGMTMEMFKKDHKPFTRIRNWGGQFDDGQGMISIPTLRRTHIILRSMKPASDILERHAASTAYRPSSIFYDKHLFGGLNLVAIHHPEDARAVRTVLMHQLNPKAVAEFNPQSSAYASLLCMRLVDMPEHAADIIDRTMKDLTMRIFMGNLPAYCREKVEEHEAVAGAIPTPLLAPLLDLFPFFLRLPRWLPGFGFEREGAIYYGRNRKYWHWLHSFGPSPENSIAANLMGSEHVAMSEFSPDQIESIVGAQIGSNFVPAAILQVFLLAMLLHPQVFQHAKAEMLKVVGFSRIPTVSDEGALPYLRAVLSETIRWRSVVPLTQPHVLTSDILRGSMCLPAGSLIWVDLHSLSKDDILYYRPDEFQPARYLTTDGRYIRKFEVPIYGFGQRRCPGATLANQTLFTCVAALIWALDLEPCPQHSALASSIDIDMWRSQLGFVFPHRYRARYSLRCSETLELLKARWVERQ